MNPYRFLLVGLLASGISGTASQDEATTLALGKRSYSARLLFQDSFESAKNWIVEAKGAFTTGEGALL